jgi:hypothetical protein
MVGTTVGGIRGVDYLFVTTHVMDFSLSGNLYFHKFVDVDL